MICNPPSPSTIPLHFYPLENLKLCSKRQSEHIPEIGVAIAVESHEVDIIRAQLIEHRDTLYTLAPVVRNLVGKAL